MAENKSWETLKEKGNALFKQNKYQEAISFYERAIKINDSIEVLYSNKGTCEKCLKEYKLAIKDFNKAIKLNPRYAEAYFSRGLTKGMNKQYNECLSDLEKAKDLFLEQNNLTKYEEVNSFINKIKTKE